MEVLNEELLETNIHGLTGSRILEKAWLWSLLWEILKLRKVVTKTPLYFSPFPHFSSENHKKWIINQFHTYNLARQKCGVRNYSKEKALRNIYEKNRTRRLLPQAQDATELQFNTNESRFARRAEGISNYEFYLPPCLHFAPSRG